MTFLLSLGEGETWNILTAYGLKTAWAFKSDSSGVKFEFHQNVTLSLVSLSDSTSCILALVLKNSVKSRMKSVKILVQQMDTENAH